MFDFYSILRPFFMLLDAEVAHKLVISCLKFGSIPSRNNTATALQLKLFDRGFLNPLGLAAGFDKDAEVINPMLRMGFSFVEVGTVTLHPQPGNEKPRIFRDIKNKSVINRMGFPGRGLDVFLKNIQRFRKEQPHTAGILGVNIGINKETKTPIEDYQACIDKLSDCADYITINVSSPNTAGLRDLQAKDELDRLLGSLKCKLPLFLKIAPDLTPSQRQDIADVVLRYRIAGLVISNTTITRPEKLSDSLKEEKGGLSGALVKDLSTEVIRDFYEKTEGKISIIGVGGISSAEDAYEKIKAGASLVQLYTGLVYQGPALITKILKGLPELLKKDGFNHISEAVGSETRAGRIKVDAVV